MTCAAGEVSSAVDGDGVAAMTLGLINANPVVHAKKERTVRNEDAHADDLVDPLDIFDILSSPYNYYALFGLLCCIPSFSLYLIRSFLLIAAEDLFPVGSDWITSH